MKKRHMKVVAILSAAAMVGVMLAGCGSSSDSAESAASAAASAASSAVSEAAEAAESAASAASAASSAVSEAAEEDHADAAAAATENMTAADPADGGGYLIGFSNCYIGNTWRTQYIEEVEARFEEYKESGVLSDYMLTNANNDITEQLNHVNSMINAGCDAIILDPISLSGMEDVVENALDEGIVVVIAEQESAYPGTYAITQNWVDQLTLQLEYMVQKLGGKGDICYLSGVAGNPNCTSRDNEFDRYMEMYPDINVLASEPGMWSESDAQNIVSTWLNTYDNIDYIVGQDVMALGTIQAYENANLVPENVLGDVDRAFLKVWNEQYPDLHTIGSPCATSPGVWSIDLCVGLLQGKTLNEDMLSPSLDDPSLVNVIKLPIPYAILHEDDINGGMPEFMDWMAENYPTTAIYSKEEALANTEGMPDGYLLGADFDVMHECFK